MMIETPRACKSGRARWRLNQTRRPSLLGRRGHEASPSFKLSGRSGQSVAHAHLPTSEQGHPCGSGIRCTSLLAGVSFLGERDMEKCTLVLFTPSYVSQAPRGLSTREVDITLPQRRQKVL